MFNMIQFNIFRYQPFDLASGLFPQPVNHLPRWKQQEIAGGGPKAPRGGRKGATAEEGWGAQGIGRRIDERGPDSKDFAVN